MMPGDDFIEEFTMLSKQLGGIEPVSILMMIIAILVALLFITAMIIRGQGTQIGEILRTNRLIIKTAEDRHKRDIDRFEQRLKDAEERADLKDAETYRLQDEKLALIREYEDRITELKREIDKAIRKINNQESQFNFSLDTKKKKIDDLTEEKGELKEENNILNEENTDLKEKITNALEANERIADNLTQEVEKNNNLLDQMKTSDIAYSKELEKLNDINTSLEKNVVLLMKKIEQLENENTKLKTSEIIKVEDDSNDNIIDHSD